MVHRSLADGQDAACRCPALANSVHAVVGLPVFRLFAGLAADPRRLLGDSEGTSSLAAECHLLIRATDRSSPPTRAPTIVTRPTKNDVDRGASPRSASPSAWRPAKSRARAKYAFPPPAARHRRICRRAA